MNGRIAVMGGTEYDTRIGCTLLGRHGLLCDGYPVAATSKEQDRLQHVDQQELRLRVRELAERLRLNNYECLLIFCNSLSFAVDPEGLSRELKLRIVSPVSIYRSLASRFDRLFVVAANGQCLSGVERTVMDCRAGVEVIGFSNLGMTNAIEEGLPLEEASRRFCFNLISCLAERLSAQCLVLGCTHLTDMGRIVGNSADIPVIDVGRELVREVLGE